MRYVGAWALLAVLAFGAGCSDDGSGDASDPSTAGSSPTASADASPTPTADTSPTPTADPRLEPEAVIERSGGEDSPDGVTRGARGRLLVLYAASRGFPGIAWRVYDRDGTVLGEGSGRGVAHDSPALWRAADGFVVDFNSLQFFVAADGTATRLRTVFTNELAEPGAWFGRGFVLDLDAGTVHQPRISGCSRLGGVRVGAGGRLWCTDKAVEQARWSDDGGRTWKTHPFASPHFVYCDGGGVPGLAPYGRHVAIVSETLEFSHDDGSTWHEVTAPPYVMEMLGQDVVASNCPYVVGMPEGRMLVTYFRSILATDATNTAFAPSPASFAEDDVLFDVNGYRQTRVSFTLGESWQPFDVQRLISHWKAGG